MITVNGKSGKFSLEWNSSNNNKKCFDKSYSVRNDLDDTQSNVTVSFYLINFVLQTFLSNRFYLLFAIMIIYLLCINCDCVYAQPQISDLVSIDCAIEHK